MDKIENAPVSVEFHWAPVRSLRWFLAEIESPTKFEIALRGSKK